MRRSRLLLALPLVLAATACGGETPTASDSGTRPEATTTQKTKNLPNETPRAPKLLLRSSAGSQEAVPGSSCVSGQGVGVCSDGAYPHPKQLSIVRPGEVITVSLEQAQVVRAETCKGGRERDCIGVIRVHPLGCEQLVAYTISLEPGQATRWKVAVPPGAYELETFAYFESDDGRTGGDVSGGFGLYVDASRSAAVVPVKSVRSDRFAC
ncbi:MAG TPA: hypothetical protein VES61_00390 [Gaiellaceae bacterium]|nr:hypothetical protein [Gaiellaceae bacterium]